MFVSSATFRHARRLFVLAAAVAFSSSLAWSADSGATVTRQVRIMDFSHLTRPMTVVFRYTPLVRNAAGQAVIEPFKGTLRIHGVFSNLPPASLLGPPFLTYTLWQVTADGRTTNLGEVELTGNSGEISTKSRSWRFGLIVTAEPYFAVSQPSSQVAFESDVAPGSGTNAPLTPARCELLRTPIGAPFLAHDPPDPKAASQPLLFEEARRAIAVARAAGAAEYSPETFETAVQTLKIAGNLLAQGARPKDVHDAAMEAVLIAEDARVLAVARRNRVQAPAAAP
jgi:hypothetical protein